MAAKKRPRTPRKPPLPVVRLRDDLLGRAALILSAPPTKPWIRRPVPRGSRVARFVLPLEFCQPQNRTRHGKPWVLGKLKENVWETMRAQCAKWPEPLRGRPQVLCVRFTRGEPDPLADWGKHAVDVLCAPTARAPVQRLNIIVDDRPSAAEVVQWSEPPGPGGPSFCLIEVWSG